MTDIEKDEMSWDHLKILDFYVLFPHLISSISLPREMVEHKAKLKKVLPPYENLPSPSRLMFELGQIQEQTIKSLIAKGIAEKEPFLSGKVKFRFLILPKEIHKTIADEKFRQQVWYKFLTTTLMQIPLKGAHGLKDRTGLMEYRYDVA